MNAFHIQGLQIYGTKREWEELASAFLRSAVLIIAKLIRSRFIGCTDPSPFVQVRVYVLGAVVMVSLLCGSIPARKITMPSPMCR
jgi:hypothetical protein